MPVGVCGTTTRTSGRVTTTPPIGGKEMRLVRCVGRRDVTFRCRECKDVSRMPTFRWGWCSVILLSGYEWRGRFGVGDVEEGVVVTALVIVTMGFV